MKGENERLLLTILNEAYPGQWESEYQGIMGRKYRFDCACPKARVAVEIEGGIWTNGRHVTGVGCTGDMEKYNLALLEGWKVLRYTPQQLRKTPWKLLRDVSVLMGAPKGQLRLDGLQQISISKAVQVAIA